ncbi:MAG: Hsp33 family molecular chaperone HslO [Deltaproteobacteria bacterium]|nr:Hsp33 family molecular chaperone HslO [Nannocystaceae bacterium]
MDGLLRGINAEHTVRVVAAVTTDLVRECCRRHQLRGVEALALGRALCAGCVMVTLTKHEAERVRISLQADGPIGRLLVDATGSGDVRGCLERRLAHPEEVPSDPARAHIARWVGTGHLVVTRDLGLEQQYQGVIEARSGEVDRDLERYLEDSEQLPSALGCAIVLDASGEVLRAAAVLCQSFPGAPPSVLEPIREALAGDGLTELLHCDRRPEELMGFAMLGDEFEALGEHPLRFRCTCGPERALAVLTTLGADDLEQLAREEGETEVRCSYCNEAYHVGSEQLFALAARMREHRS